jgi:hypothetical protein
MNHLFKHCKVIVNDWFKAFTISIDLLIGNLFRGYVVSLIANGVFPSIPAFHSSTCLFRVSACLMHALMGSIAIGTLPGPPSYIVTALPLWCALIKLGQSYVAWIFLCRHLRIGKSLASLKPSIWNETKLLLCWPSQFRSNQELRYDQWVPAFRLKIISNPSNFTNHLEPF